LAKIAGKRRGKMREELLKIKQEAEKALAAATDSAALEQVRVRYLGKKGELTKVSRSMRDIPPEERPVIGRLVNEVKASLESLLEERRQEVERAEKERRLGAEVIDITLPGRVRRPGTPHPLRATLAEIEDVFIRMGFQVATGPEVETDYYNFEALNIPSDHPARDMQDSFYISRDVLLRTHTSPVQIRYMQAHAPELPVKIISPGRVYRRDDDPTHSPMFYQVEGLQVDHGITFGDLKGVLLAWARAMYGEGTRIRLRPSYFPFTEPSAEVDVSCTMCGGEGCRVCKGTGWLEVLGAGMVHPTVLRNGGYDPEKVTGFAFGMGVERIAMLKYGIDDIRLFYANDIRFLRQFGGIGA